MEFSPRNLGKMKPFWLAHIFQRGWWKTTNQTCRFSPRGLVLRNPPVCWVCWNHGAPIPSAKNVSYKKESPPPSQGEGMWLEELEASHIFSSIAFLNFKIELPDLNFDTFLSRNRARAWVTNPSPKFSAVREWYVATTTTMEEDGIFARFLAKEETLGWSEYRFCPRSSVQKPQYVQTRHPKMISFPVMGVVSFQFWQFQHWIDWRRHAGLILLVVPIVVQRDSGALARKAPRPVNLPLVKHATRAPSAQGKTITDQAPSVWKLMTESPATAALRTVKSCHTISIQTRAAAKPPKSRYSLPSSTCIAHLPRFVQHLNHEHLLRWGRSLCKCQKRCFFCTTR